MEEERAIFLLHQLLEIENINDVQELVFRLSWESKTYQQIAEQSDYDPDYIRDIGFRLWRDLSQKLGIKVTKKNIHSVLTDYVNNNLEARGKNPQETFIIDDKQFQDWGEAIDTNTFYGRSTELESVSKWIVEDGCRLVGIFGIGGVGKTAFSAELARRIGRKFDYLIWRSLRNAPTFENILIDIIGFLSHRQHSELNLSQDTDSKLRMLLTYLRQQKCLIILDNVESILQSCAGTYDGREGCYLYGYNGYGQLLRLVAETKHQSSLLVTSREIPIGFWRLSGENSVTRYLRLTGLDITDSKKVLQDQGNLQGSNNNFAKLINYYARNPLYLRIISASIRELFNSNLTEFWKTDIELFGDINDVLEQQFNRLSNLEKEIMYWLSLSRRSLTISELQEKVFDNISDNQLLTEVQSLKQRSLIEKTQIGFTLQPVVMDFFIQRFLEKNAKKITR
ncbi:MAG: NB-ARC domain-containing protein [Xenococcus sp. (in: cyanobacteria)]